MDVQKNLVFAQLTKVDEEKRLVYGRAVQEVPDRVGEVFDYETSKPLFEAWSKSQSESSMGKSFGNVRAMHKDVAAGIVVPGGLVFHDDEMAIDICAKISDDNEWGKVMDGVYTGFSIGGKYAKKWEDAELKKTRYTADPSEVSLVDRPCVPTATFFEIQKADGSVLQKNFIDPPKDDAPAEQKKEEPAPLPRPELITKAVALGNDAAAIAGLTNAELTELIAKGNKPDPEPEPIEVAGSDEEVIAFAKYLNDHKMTMGDALNKVAAREDVNPERGKTEYGNVKFADAKNKKYPIDNEEHIRAAWNYISKDKNASKYSADDLKTIKAAIVAAWKDKIDKEGPPSMAEGAKKAVAVADLQKRRPNLSAEGAAAEYESAQLRKGLATCGDLAYLIQSLAYLTERVEYEAAAEDDGSPLPAKLNETIATLGDLLVQMVEEEVGEQIEGKEVEPEMQPVMAMAQAARDLTKRAKALVKEPLEKADSSIVQSMHDNAVKLGASCSAAKAAKAAPTVDEELAKQLKEGNETLTKALSDAAETIKKLSKDVEMLKAQPMPRVRLTAVSKGQDVSGSDDRQEVASITKRDGTVDDVATALKKIHATGGTPVRLR